MSQSVPVGQNILCGFFLVFFHSLHEIAGFSLSGNEDQTRVGEGFPTKLNETSLQKGTAQTQLQEPGFFEVL